MLLSLLDGFRHVDLEPRHIGRPRAEQHLIEPVFVVAVGGGLAVDEGARPLVETHPLRDLTLPVVRHLGERVDPRPHVLAELGVMRAGGDHLVRPLLPAELVQLVELRRRYPES